MKSEFIPTPTQTIILQIKHYLENSNLDKSSLHFEKDFLTIQFASSAGVEVPTEEQLEHIKNMVFWTKQVNEVKDIDLLFQFVPSLNSLTINFMKYDIISGIYHKMIEYGMDVCVIDPAHSSKFFNDLCFVYDPIGRATFNYDELGELQNIIDPSIANHDSIRVVGCGTTYTLRACIG